MRSVGRWILGCVALGALWLLYQGEWNAMQLYAAMSAGALSLLVAWVVWQRALPSLRVEPSYLRRAVRIPWQVVREFALVTLYLVRRRGAEGEFRALRFPAGGARPHERGRRAFVALATGYSPNSYVVDVDEEHGLVLVHVLHEVPPGQEVV